MNIIKKFTPNQFITAEEANEIAQEHDSVRISHDLGVIDEVIRRKCKEGFYDAYIDLTMIYCYPKVKDILLSKGYKVNYFEPFIDGHGMIYISWAEPKKSKWVMFRRKSK